MVDEATQADLTAMGLALNPSWLAETPLATNGFGHGELAAAVHPEVTCAWLSPRGPSDGGIITSIARVPAGQEKAITALAAQYTDAEQHRSAAVGSEFVVGTVWLDNRLADRYLEQVEAIAS